MTQSNRARAGAALALVALVAGCSDADVKRADRAAAKAGRAVDRAGASIDRAGHKLDHSVKAVRWSREFGQVVKVGSTERKDGPDDGQAEAVFG